MKETGKRNHEAYPIPVLRENLRREASLLSGKLSRSVARLTSADALPCEEYGAEVETQRSFCERLMYLQHCRNALERCIAGKTAHLRWHWQDGTVSETRFRKCGVNRVEVRGLEKSA